MTTDRNQTGTSWVLARSNPFRRNRNITPLLPEEAQRQGAISAFASQPLGGCEAALDFPNTENALVGGRPMAIATSSKAGYLSVEREIRPRTVVPGGRHDG
jgi:hypothetical protein